MKHTAISWKIFLSPVSLFVDKILITWYETISALCCLKGSSNWTLAIRLVSNEGHSRISNRAIFEVTRANCVATVDAGSFKINSTRFDLIVSLSASGIPASVEVLWGLLGLKNRH